MGPILSIYIIKYVYIVTTLIVFLKMILIEIVVERFKNFKLKLQKYLLKN